MLKRGLDKERTKQKKKKQAFGVNRHSALQENFNYLSYGAVTESQMRSTVLNRIRVIKRAQDGQATAKSLSDLACVWA
jgi:methylmalonyl-CoA mutase N-terminal domain/subunit